MDTISIFTQRYSGSNFIVRKIFQLLLVFSIPFTVLLLSNCRKDQFGNGNISFGLKEHAIFPEIQSDRADVQKGMDITLVTTARTADEVKALLAGFNVPFLIVETNNNQQ